MLRLGSVDLRGQEVGLRAEPIDSPVQFMSGGGLRSSNQGRGRLGRWTLMATALRSFATQDVAPLGEDGYCSTPTFHCPCWPSLYLWPLRPQNSLSGPSKRNASILPWLMLMTLRPIVKSFGRDEQRKDGGGAAPRASMARIHQSDIVRSRILTGDLMHMEPF